MWSWERIDGIVEAVSVGIDRGLNPTMNQPRFGGELAPIVGRSGHDGTTIVSHDRGSLLIAAVRFDLVGWAVSISRFSVLLMHDRHPFDEDPTVPTSRQVSRRLRSSASWRSDAPCVATMRIRLAYIVAARSRSRGIRVDEDPCCS